MVRTEQREVAPGVHAATASFDAGPMTQYVVEGSSRVALVDSGVRTTPELDIGPLLAHIGATWGDVDWLLVTHAHHDHVGGNGAVRGLAPGARIAVHHADRAWAEDVEHYLTRLYRTTCPAAWQPSPAFEERILDLWGANTLVDMPLAGGDDIDLGGGRVLHVVDTPAHSPGHVCFHDPENAVLFAGDALQLDGVHMFGDRPWLFALYSSVEAYVRSLETMAALEPQVVCTAHRGVLGADEFAAALVEARSWLERIETAITEHLGDVGAASLVSVVDHLLARWPQYERGLQIFVTAEAHLDELNRRGVVAPRMSAGAKVWGLTDGVHA